MDVFEANTHSFIVKVWLEESAEETGQAIWKGYVTHVTDGERRYFQDLNEIPSFIAPYLTRMGVKFGIGWRLRNWLKRTK